MRGRWPRSRSRKPPWRASTTRLAITLSRLGRRTPAERTLPIGRASALGLKRTGSSRCQLTRKPWRRYVTDLAARAKPATIIRHVAAISVAHQKAQLEPPTAHVDVKAVLKGIRRELGVAQTQKAALTVENLRSLVAATSDDLLGARDRALLLIGFAAALRRSELVALTVDSLGFEQEGVKLGLRRSKTNQEGEEEVVPVLFGSDPATCPVRALQAWLSATQIHTGPIFREVYKRRVSTPKSFSLVWDVRDRALTAQSVALALKRLAKVAGIEGDFAGHSLRSGFATAAARAGKTEASIMRQTRHKSVSVARRYIRRGTIWQDHAGAGIGL